LKQQDGFIEVCNIRTRYWRAGNDGPDVVLIHGLGSSVEDWDNNLEALARHHRVFALDLVGCGLSDKPQPYDYALPQLARFILAFMSAQGIGSAHLVGFSMGARLALECAHLAPTRVRSLIAAAPAAVGRETLFDFRLISVAGIGELLTIPNAFGIRMLLRKAFADPPKVSEEMVAERLRLASLPGAQAAFLSILRGMVGCSGFHREVTADVQSWLPQVTCPTLVIWGLQDRFVPCRHAEILRERLPNGAVKFYDQCGHLPQSEQAEAFNRDGLAFLAAVGAD
jgi:pimeloyl-ACP methyl ester carboxylesterase